MQLKKLRDGIQGASDIIAAAGYRAPAKEVASLARVLQGDDKRSCDEALGEIEDLLEREKQALRLKLIDELKMAGSDRAVFSRVHSELSKDKRLDKADVDFVAHAYAGGRKKWASRRAGLNAIKTKFDERAYRASKMKIVERTKVW